MDRLFPLPFYTFLKIVFKKGGVTPKHLKNFVPWVIKTIVLEPVRWIELAVFNQKIQRHKITKDPIFVLGFYRSGTSYLHQLFTMDDRLGYHSNFHMVFPEIMLSSEKVLLPFLEFICRTFNIRDSVHRVPLSFRFPGEEDTAMTTASNPRGVQWGFIVPRMMEEVFRNYVMYEDIPESEKEGWIQDFVFLLKKTSLANEGKQLVLKSPPNTARIKLLLSIFPNAKFVFIHRNPYEVYLSNKKFWKVVQSKFALGGASQAEINAIILDTYAKMMHRYLLDKDLVPEGQLVEIAYEDLIQNPVESMRNMYKTLHLENFGYCENAIQSFVERQESFVRLKHEIPEDEKQTVTETFEPFIKTWNYLLL